MRLGVGKHEGSTLFGLHLGSKFLFFDHHRGRCSLQLNGDDDGDGDDDEEWEEYLLKGKKSNKKIHK